MSKITNRVSTPKRLFRILFKWAFKKFSRQTTQNITTPQLPPNNDPQIWRNLWQTQQQFREWRTEPEIDLERQVELRRRLEIMPDIKLGIYPFKGIRLSRADVEWLLATHENGRGPVDWNDSSQRTRSGLDLRGAILNNADLSGLPLTRMLGGLAKSEWANTTLEQRELAAVHLEQANLIGTHLEAANLGRAHLKRANLKRAHLENAYLRVARLELSDLGETHLEGADLSRAHLQHAYLRLAHLEGVNLEEAHLEGASLREACLCGKLVQQCGEGDLQLPPANLQGVYFDAATNLQDTQLGDEEYGFVRLADVRWGNANLAVIDWAKITMLGDESQARQQKKRNGEPKMRNEVLNEYHMAVRANRQLAVILRDQGLHEEASYFAYCAQVLQRQVLLQKLLQQHTLQKKLLFVIVMVLELLLQPAELQFGIFLVHSPLHFVSTLVKQLGISPLALLPALFLVVVLLLEYILPRLPWLEAQKPPTNIPTLPLALTGVLIITLLVILITLLLLLLFLICIFPFVYLPPTYLLFILLICLLLGGLIYLLRKYHRRIFLLLYIFIHLQELEESKQYVLSLFRMFFYALVDCGRYSWSLFLDLLAGYGYKPTRSVVAYLLIISIFATVYYFLGSTGLPPLTPLEAIIFSVASFHGRGFFPSNAITLSDPLVMLAALEAVVGLITEISFIATFTYRFLGK